MEFECSYCSTQASTYCKKCQRSFCGRCQQNTCGIPGDPGNCGPYGEQPAPEMPVPLHVGNSGERTTVDQLIKGATITTPIDTPQQNNDIRLGPEHTRDGKW